MTLETVRRAARITVAAIVLAVAASAPAEAAGEVVLGAPGLYGEHGLGWGTERPSEIFNGGVPSGYVQEVGWENWGGRIARGSGLVPTYRPGGGYYAKRVPIRLRASRIRTCPGESGRAYTRMIVRHRTKPGGPWSDWFPWTLDLCDRDAKPKRCGSVGFTPNSDDGAFGITAFDTRCRTAKRVARASEQIGIEPGDPANYRFRFRRFVCNGYSFDSDAFPTIDWTCSRKTAVVTFDRS